MLNSFKMHTSALERLSPWDPPKYSFLLLTAAANIALGNTQPSLHAAFLGPSDHHSRHPTFPGHVTPASSSVMLISRTLSLKWVMQGQKEQSPHDPGLWFLIIGPYPQGWTYQLHLHHHIPGFAWVSQSWHNLVCDLTLPERVRSYNIKRTLKIQE